MNQLRKLTSLNFLPKTWTKLSLLLWLSFVNGQLSPIDVDVFEGHCRDIPPAANFSENAHKLFQYGVYTVPFASQSKIRGHAAMFLGRLAKSQQELDQMCLNILFAGLVFQMAYGNKIFIGIPEEPTTSGGKFGYSHRLIRTPGVDVSFQETSTETVVLSNWKSWAMFVRCINGKYMDWKVAARSGTTINEEEKAQIFNKAVELGFNTSLAFKQEKSSYPCPPVPSTPEAIAKILLEFQVFSNDSSQLLQKLPQPIVQKGKSFPTVAQFLFHLLINTAGGKLAIQIMEHRESKAASILHRMYMYSDNGNGSGGIEQYDVDGSTSTVNQCTNRVI